MNDADSVPRSLRRWVTAVLPSDYDVRLVETPVAVPDASRPVALILSGSDMDTIFARASVPQGDIQRGQTFVVTVYPPLGATPQEAAATARSLAGRLDDALVYGMKKDAGGEYSAPRSVPLWDWTGIPIVGAGREGPVNPVSRLDEETHSVRAIPDPDDPKRQTVVMSVRLTWWSPGRARDEGQPVVSMPGGWHPPSTPAPAVPFVPPSQYVLSGEGPPDEEDPGEVYIDELTGDIYFKESD